MFRLRYFISLITCNFFLNRSCSYNRYWIFDIYLKLEKHEWACLLIIGHIFLLFFQPSLISQLLFDCCLLLINTWTIIFSLWFYYYFIFIVVVDNVIEYDIFLPGIYSFIYKWYDWVFLTQIAGFFVNNLSSSHLRLFLCFSS